MTVTDAAEPTADARRQLDYLLKEADLRLKQRKISAKQPARISAVVVAIVAALVGFAGNLVVTDRQAASAAALERDKLQGSLVIESIKTGDTTAAAKNLDFLLKTGLLQDPDHRITKYLQASEKVPVLPASRGSEIVGAPVEDLPSDHRYRRIGAAVGEVQLQTATCTAFLISRNLALTTAHCVVNQPPFHLALGYMSNAVPPIIFPVVSIEEIDHDLDYAILKVSANPGDEYGVIKLAAVHPRVPSDVAVLHHSKAMPLHVSSGKLLEVTATDLIYDCQTAAGAGGAPVIGESGELVGMHLGGTNFQGKLVKKGLRVDAILAKSTVLRNLGLGVPGKAAPR